MDKIKGTVTLDLKEYNELRDFKENIRAGYTYVISIGAWSLSTRYIGTDKALEKMGQEIKYVKEKAENRIEELTQAVKNKQKQIDAFNEPKELKSIDEIKAMSWREFKKWKKR